MAPSVKLKDIINEMDFQNEEVSAYLNKKTGEVVSNQSESFQAAENEKPLEEYPEWQHEFILIAKDILNSPDDYVALPSQFEIHEYEIMERFCLAVEDAKTRDKLLRAIKGTGAFRMFKETIADFNMRDDWYRFREEAFKEIAVHWCKQNDIPFVDDTETKQNLL